MHMRTMIGTVVVALALSGCAGSGGVFNQAQQQSLQSLQLFNADSSPRFSLYLACSGEDASCVTVGREFAAWAEARQIQLRQVAPADAPFGGGGASAPTSAASPYRLAVRFVPLIVPSFNVTNRDVSGAMQGGYTPPKVGYSATVQVFDSASGKLLAKLPVREQRTAEFKGNAATYIHAEVQRFIAGLDPAWQRR
jgi:hypothetical protein